MAEQWCQGSLQENSAKSFWGCHSCSVFSYSNQLDWLNASLYFMNFTLQLEIGWMLPLAQSQYFSHVCIQPFECCILSLFAPKIYFGCHNPSIAIDLFFPHLKFHQPHFSLPTLGMNVQVQLFTLALLPPTSEGWWAQLRCQLWAQETLSCLGPSAWGCALQPVVHLATGLYLPEGHFEGGWAYSGNTYLLWALETNSGI